MSGTTTITLTVEQRDLIVAALTGATIQVQPAKATPAKATKARKAKKAKKATGPTFMDLRNALKTLKALGHVQPGVTVKEAIAAGYMNADGTLGTAQAAPKAKQAKQAPAKPAKKGKKAKKVAAVLEPAEPAAMRACDAPRDAMGHVTKKETWAMRESLAQTGQFDRHEIDSIVASAFA